MTQAGIWRPDAAAGEGLGCGHGHTGGGRLDEAARRLSHEEYAVARILAVEGHDVRSLAACPGRGRRPDLAVCGSGVEVKSFLPAAARDGRRPTPEGVFNKLADAAGQAGAVVLVGHGSGLTEATVRRGLARYLAERPGTPLRSVRAMGDGFDLAWSRRPGLVQERSPLVRGPTGLGAGLGTNR